MLQLKQRKEGFTIIEVMIVLAIAGLIMLIVFLAVPALNRNSHNTQRKNDVSSVLGAVNEYASNNSGALPTNAGQITANAKLGFYQATDVQYADNTTFRSTMPTAAGRENSIWVYGYAKCNGNTLEGTQANVTKRNVAAIYYIETSGGTTNICQDM